MKTKLFFTVLHFLLFAFCALLLFSSCEKDQLTQDEYSAADDYSSYVKTANDSNLFKYAKLLSLAIQKNPKITSILEVKTKKLLQRGYYEKEFYAAMEGNVLETNLSMNTLDATLIDVGNEKTSVFLKDLYKSNPYLSVLLLGDDKLKGFNNRVYVDNGFDDMNPKSTIYYFENGELFSHRIS